MLRDKERVKEDGILRGETGVKVPAPLKGDRQVGERRPYFATIMNGQDMMHVHLRQKTSQWACNGGARQDHGSRIQCFMLDGNVGSYD